MSYNKNSMERVYNGMLLFVMAGFVYSKYGKLPSPPKPKATVVEEELYDPEEIEGDIPPEVEPPTPPPLTDQEKCSLEGAGHIWIPHQNRCVSPDDLIQEGLACESSGGSYDPIMYVCNPKTPQEACPPGFRRGVGGLCVPAGRLPPGVRIRLPPPYVPPIKIPGLEDYEAEDEGIPTDISPPISPMEREQKWRVEVSEDDFYGEYVERKTIPKPQYGRNVSDPLYELEDESQTPYVRYVPDVEEEIGY